MTTIKASCPVCGEVELTAADMSLMVCTSAPLSYYAFRCPVCRDEVRKPADDHVISLLMSGGVRASVWEVPQEALEPRSGAALTYDDLLDFALQLAGHDYLAARGSEQPALTSPPRDPWAFVGPARPDGRHPFG